MKEFIIFVCFFVSILNAIVNNEEFGIAKPNELNSNNRILSLFSIQSMSFLITGGAKGNFERYFLL